MSFYGSLKGFQRYSRAYTGDISSSEASNFIVDASTEIEGIISPRYTIPVTGTPPLLSLFCNKLAAYRALDALLGDVQPNASEANTRKLIETLIDLRKIATGSLFLVSSAGTIIATKAAIDGNTIAYGMALTRTNEESTSENVPIEDWARLD